MRKHLSELCFAKPGDGAMDRCRRTRGHVNSEKPEHRDHFDNDTGRTWNNLADPETPKTGECPTCGDRLALRKNGTLWNHTDKGANYEGRPFGPRCDGSGKHPAPGSMRERD